MTRLTCSRLALTVAAVAVGLTHAGWWWLLDYGPPRLRDPEYGKRLAVCKAAPPGRRLVAVFGSSRVAYGLRPGVVAEWANMESGRPLVANLALAGSGPVMELMAFRRALADGLRPAAVLVEYWPAFLRQDGPYREEARIDLARLRPVDEGVVRDYFHAPDRTLLTLRRNRWFGVSAHRKPLLNQIAPRWLPVAARTDGTWDKIDATGWLPGHAAVEADTAAKAWAATEGYYRPLFDGYHVGADSDRALGQLVAEARAAGVPVGLLVLPESAAFTRLMPPEVRAAAADHLTRMGATLGVPLIDARGWVADDELPDGFHLTQAGAAAVSRRLGPALVDAFPEVR